MYEKRLILRTRDNREAQILSGGRMCVEPIVITAVQWKRFHWKQSRKRLVRGEVADNHKAELGN